MKRLLVAALIGVATLSGCSHPKCDDVQDIEIMIRWFGHRFAEASNPGEMEALQEEIAKQQEKLAEAKKDCKDHGRIG